MRPSMIPNSAALLNRASNHQRMTPAAVDIRKQARGLRCCCSEVNLANLQRSLRECSRSRAKAMAIPFPPYRVAVRIWPIICKCSFDPSGRQGEVDSRICES